MRTRLLPVLPVLVALAACQQDDSPAQPPPLEAPALYRLSPTLCGDDCRTLTLYRADEFLELRAHEVDGTYAGRASGTLADEASAELDQLLNVDELGELPGDVPIDSPIIDLWLPGLHLSYAQDHPPTGLAALDALSGRLLDDLSQCRTTADLTPDGDCEALAHFPE